MGKTLIRVDCVDQRLFVTSPQSIASGGRNEDVIEFNFCPLWAGYAKTAVFYRSEDDVYHAVLSGNQCIIPHEVLQDDGIMYFGVFGTKGDTTRTSEVIRYRVVKGALTTGTKPSDPTPDIYAQIATKLANIESFVEPGDPYSITGDLVQLENYEGMPMDCVTRIEPVQAGSGDPYPAGGGKNKLDGTKFAARTTNGVTFTVNTDGSIKVSGTATSTANTFTDITGKLSPGTYVLSHSSDFGAAAYVQITSASGSKNYWDGQPFTLDGTETKIVAYLQINAGTYNGTAYLQIEAGSTPTAYTPYANIRPISGRTGAALTRSGKNLFPDKMTDREVNGVTFKVNADKSITTSGTASDLVVVYIGTNRLLAGDYILSGCPPKGGSHQLRVLAVGIPGGPYFDDNGEGNRFTLTQDSDVQCSIIIRAGHNVDGLTFYPMLRLASVADAAYEPYQGETFALDFGQTVYGGTLDWNKGVLTVDGKIMTLTGDENWMWFEKYDFLYMNGLQSAFEQWPKDLVCSHYKAPIVETETNPFVTIVSTGTYIDQLRFYRTGYTSADAWKAFLAAQYAAGTPVQVCYKLAEPITIQLTPQYVAALQGINYIWSDAGETTVSGRKDVLWLTSGLLKRIAELEGLVAALTAAAAE